MSLELNEFRRELFTDFLNFHNSGKTLDLADLLQKYKKGPVLKAEFYALMPVTAAYSGAVPALGDKNTEFSLHFRINYQYWQENREINQSTPCLVNFWRSVAAIRFDVNKARSSDYRIDIEEFAETKEYGKWAEEHLAAISWQNMLLHVVVDFAKAENIPELSIAAEYSSLALQNGFRPGRFIKEVN